MFEQFCDVAHMTDACSGAAGDYIHSCLLVRKVDAARNSWLEHRVCFCNVYHMAVLPLRLEKCSALYICAPWQTAASNATKNHRVC